MPIAVLIPLAVACGAVGPVVVETPLIGAEHGAVVLTEGRDLSNPRSVEQNRLLRGWRFVRRIGRRPLLQPEGTASVVELTHLEQRVRSLIVETVDDPPDSTVSVTAGDHHLGTFSLAPRVEIPLPNDLPVGRATVTLSFSDPGRTSVNRLAVTPVHASGTVAVDPGGFSQMGWSAVEITRRLSGGGRLAAEFIPPNLPQPGQTFILTMERRPGEPVEVFKWPGPPAETVDEPQLIDVDLGPEPGFVRFRFIARGQGPAARWQHSRLIEPTSPADPPLATAHLDPPRLIILYVMDALRADHVGRNGLTPVLDRLAAEGVRFENHFAVAPNTPPSTRALFSGLTMLDDRQLPHPGPTRLAESFRDAGYRTASVTGNPHLGPELDLAAGFEIVKLLPLEEDHHPDASPTVNDNAEVLHREALRLIRALPPGERGFLYLHTMNPHNPYTPPPEIEAAVAPPGGSTIDGRTRTLVAVRDQDRLIDEDDRRRLRQLYAAGVAYNDRELGRFMDSLNDLIDPREVLLIATSDHGEELFEHGGVLHGHTLYDELVRIPLVIHWPGSVRPHTISAPTTTLDVHATLLELAAGTTAPSTGRSLWPELTAAAETMPVDRLVFAAAPGLEGATMVRSARRKLILAPRNGVRRGQGFGLGRTGDLEYVFDLEADPGEQANLAGTANLEVAWLRTRLLGWIRVQQSLQPSPGQQTMSSTTRDQLEALGYVVD
jgi:arylsulfatase A-like enzyme